MYNQIKLRYVSAVSAVYIQGLGLAYDYLERDRNVQYNVVAPELGHKA